MPQRDDYVNAEGHRSVVLFDDFFAIVREGKKAPPKKLAAGPKKDTREPEFLGKLLEHLRGVSVIPMRQASWQAIVSWVTLNPEAVWDRKKQGVAPSAWILDIDIPVTSLDEDDKIQSNPLLECIRPLGLPLRDGIDVGGFLRLDGGRVRTALETEAWCIDESMKKAPLPPTKSLNKLPVRRPGKANGDTDKADWPLIPIFFLSKFHFTDSYRISKISDRVKTLVQKRFFYFRKDLANMQVVQEYPGDGKPLSLTDFAAMVAQEANI